MRQMVNLTPVDPPGPTRGVELAGPSQVAGGVGGWEPIDRPRLTQVLEWTGTPLRTLILPIALVAHTNDPTVPDIDIEAAMTRVESWSRPTSATGQPAIYTVSGPVRHLGRRYVVSGVEWDNDTYEADSRGARIQQFGTLSLLEYAAAAVIVLANPTKKARAKKGKTTKRARTATVRNGDTLGKIAARELGSAKQWTEIAKLNGIRDPSAIRAGRVLKLP